MSFVLLFVLVDRVTVDAGLLLCASDGRALLFLRGFNCGRRWERSAWVTLSADFLLGCYAALGGFTLVVVHRVRRAVLRHRIFVVVRRGVVGSPIAAVLGRTLLSGDRLGCSSSIHAMSFLAFKLLRELDTIQ